MEATFLLDISRLGASASCAEEAFRTIGETSVCAPGIHGLTLELAGERAHSLAPERWFGAPDPEDSAIATAPLVADGFRWGWIRLYFTPRVLPEDTAARLSRFLGEQFALALGCIDLEARIADLRSKLAAGQQEVRARKAINRASVMLARSHGITEKSAKALIEEQSRRAGKGVADIAEAILLASGDRLTRQRSWIAPRLRRTA